MAKIEVAPTTHEIRAVAPTRSRQRHARRMLLFVWAITVFAPWLLQVRSFGELVVRHKITQNLVPPPDAVKLKDNVVELCPVRGLYLAGTWWNTDPTHYYKIEGGTDGSVLCHFVIPQYNIHGAYHVHNRKIAPISTAPSRCANHSYPINYFFHHGSIGYYSFYDEGDGSFCGVDNTAYLFSSGIGSSDLNFNALANFDGASGYQVSQYFGCVGLVWVVYRAIIVARSFVSCRLYGHRLDSLQEPISFACVIVYIQQASRIAPHTATNWHRAGLINLLVEGLMTDLFLIIAHEGVSTKLQYISLGYNITGFLSILFEILENTTLLRPTWLLFFKRLLFNSETTLIGEFLFALAMAHYLTALNTSSLRHTIHVAETVSHYVWSLVGHGIIVLGQTAFILSVRAVCTVCFVLWRFGSLDMLTAPCCVDHVMGFRYKLAKLSGYVYNGQQLCFAKETLKAHGLLTMSSGAGKEWLVYHRIHWLPAGEEDLAILGALVGEQVERCLESTYAGPVCDRMLGGTRDHVELRDQLDELENARFVPGANESSHGP